MNTDQAKGTLCTIISALVFGVTPVLASISFTLGSNPMTMTFYRNAFGVPVLLIFLLIRKVRLSVSAKEMGALLLISVAFSVTTTYILYSAYRYIGVGLSTTLHFLYPVITVLLGWMIYKEKISKVKGFALVLATLGVAMASGGSDSYALTGIVLAVASAVTYAGYLICLERTSIKNMDSMKAMFYICLINCIAVAIVDMPTREIVYLLPSKAMLLTFIVAVANSAFAYVLLIIGVKKIGAGNAAILSTLEPVSGVIAGVVFLGEALPAIKLISCVLILIAVLIPIVQKKS